MQVFFLRAKFLLILLPICYNSLNYNKFFNFFSWFSCHLDMICVPHPSTIKTCVSMTISQKKKLLQNILIWYFLLFLWCKNLPQKKTFIAMMHNSWWINYITPRKLLQCKNECIKRSASIMLQNVWIGYMNKQRWCHPIHQ